MSDEMSKPGLEPPRVEALRTFDVNAERLPEFSGDPCVLTEYADSDYCRLRRPGETPAAFNARRLREREALEVEITRGQTAPGVQWPSGWPLVLGLAAVVGLILWENRER